MSYRKRPDGSLAFTAPFTPEEQVVVDAHRRNLRLNIAKEEMIRSRDHYLDLKQLDLERIREEEILN